MNGCGHDAKSGVAKSGQAMQLAMALAQEQSSIPAVMCCSKLALLLYNLYIFASIKAPCQSGFLHFCHPVHLF